MVQDFSWPENSAQHLELEHEILSTNRSFDHWLVHGILYIHTLPVVPHKAVAEVSRRGKL